MNWIEPTIVGGRAGILAQAYAEEDLLDEIEEEEAYDLLDEIQEHDNDNDENDHANSPTSITTKRMSLEGDHTQDEHSEHRLLAPGGISITLALASALVSIYHSSGNRSSNSFGIKPSILSHWMQDGMNNSQHSSNNNNVYSKRNNKRLLQLVKQHQLSVDDWNATSWKCCCRGRSNDVHDESGLPTSIQLPFSFYWAKTHAHTVVNLSRFSKQ